MNAYNELDGIPCAADPMLLTTILRDQWGFDGCVVSDYFSIRQLARHHQFAVDAQDAAVKALDAGMDVELPSTDCYGEPLLDAVRRRSRRDRDARPCRASRAADEVRPRPLRAAVRRHVEDERGERHRSRTASLHARSRARASCSCATTARCRSRRTSAPSRVIGPCADDVRNLFGDYAYPAHVESIRDVLESGQGAVSPTLLGGLDISGGALESPTVLDALRERLGARVRFEPGCEVNGTRARRLRRRRRACRATPTSPIMVMGDKSGLTVDCTSGESRDCSSLDLPGVQEELIAAVAATGTPIVLVLVAGRPYGGAVAARGVRGRAAGVAPGPGGRRRDRRDTRRRGRTPAGSCRSPIRARPVRSRSSTGTRSPAAALHWKGDYVDGPAAPLYPFGYGLSYTSFALDGCSRVRRSRGHVDRDDHRRRHRREHRRARRRRGRPALRPRSAARASPVPCSS